MTERIPVEAGAGFELRPYQERMVSQIWEAFGKGWRRVLGVLPTGGGKTLIAAEVVARVVQQGGTALLVAHRKELVHQLLRKVREALPGEEVGLYLPGEEAGAARVAVGSVQTYARRRDGRRWDLVVIDEAHHARAATYRSLFEDAVSVLGLTATPVRLDGKGLGEVFDYLVQGPSIAELQDQGYLVPIRYLAARSGWDLRGVRVRAGDYAPSDLSRVARQVHLEGAVVEAYLQVAKGKRAIVYAVDVAHAKDLEARFKAAGVEAAHVTAKTPGDERDQLLARFRAGELKVLVNVELFTEGLDVPGVEVILIARPTKSLSLYMQMVGRGTRPEEGKGELLVIDVTGSVVPFFGPVEGYTRWFLTRDRLPLERVRNTSTRREGSGQRARVVEGSGALVELFARGQEAAPQDTTEYRRKFYGGLKWVAEWYGMKPGWAAYAYRDKFGEMPPYSWGHLVPPTFFGEAARWAEARYPYLRKRGLAAAAGYLT